MSEQHSAVKKETGMGEFLSDEVAGGKKRKKPIY